MNWDRHRDLLRSGAWAGLTEAGARVLFALEYHASDREGIAFPSRETLARECGLSINGVKRGLKDLAGAGLFGMTDRGPGARGRTRYTYKRLTLSPLDTVDPAATDDPDPDRRPPTLSLEEPQPCHLVTPTLSVGDTKHLKRTSPETSSGKRENENPESEPEILSGKGPGPRPFRKPVGFITIADALPDAFARLRAECEKREP